MASTFEYLRLRRAAATDAAAFSTLGTDADARKVLRHPQLVVDGDWAQLFELTGVRTDARRLEELRTRITEQALTNAALDAHGVQALLDRLRRTDGGNAQCALLSFAVDHIGDLGVAGPLPLAAVGHLPRERTSVTVSDAALPSASRSAAGGDSGSAGARPQERTSSTSSTPARPVQGG